MPILHVVNPIDEVHDNFLLHIFICFVESIMLKVISARESLTDT
jgi:hypothetical protein